MTRVISIVEGDGEVAAVPVLLRRLADWLTPAAYIEVLPPIRVRRDRFLNREDEFCRHIQLAAAKCMPDGWILILLDADDDCPVDVSRKVRLLAEKFVPHRNVSVVMANREYEAWFIASATSLNGRRGFQTIEGDAAADPEAPRNAKGWIRDRMGGSYGETTDQPALTAVFDLNLARQRSRSFRKLCAEWTKNTQAVV